MKETELLVANVVKRNDKPVNHAIKQKKISLTVGTFGISFTPSIVDQARFINNSLTWDIKW